MRKHNQIDQPDNGSRSQDNYSAENQPPQQQLIPEKGEEYLREVANIEDMPSPAEDKEAEDVLKDDEKRDSFKQ